MIPLSVPNMCGDELENLRECIDTGWLSTSGKYVEIFEKKMSDFVGSKHAIGCMSGTAALHVSLRLLGVKPQDEVIVPSLTFISPVHAIIYNFASPIFMDCDDYYNLDVSKTMDFIKNETYFENGSTYNKKSKKKITAIIPIHIWGNAVWLEDLIKLCDERNIKVLEDASESVGTFYTEGNYSKKHTGTIGSIGCLSFNANKIMTTGGGGMIITDDDYIAEKAHYLVSQAKDDPLRYIHNEVGYNYRLTNLHAAIGVSQISRLQDFLKRKKDIYKKYVEELNKIDGLEMALLPKYSNNNHWLSILQISKKYPLTTEELIENLNNKGIQVRPVWHLNHLQKHLKHYESYKIEKASKLVNMSICLPSSSNLNEIDLNFVINSLKI